MTKILSNLFLVGLLALVGSAQAGGIAAQARVKVDLVQLAQSEKALSAPTSKSSPTKVAATTTFNGTTINGKTYNRTVQACSGLSGVGTDVSYSVQEFSVDTDGAYDLTSAQDYDGFIFLYTGSFDPNDPLTSCTAGNDDGVNGTGESEILGANLTAGTPYFFVTTAFFNGDEGTFQNTISGPGGIQLPHHIALTKFTPGVVVAGDFTYDIEVKNDGANDETVTITDVLPAGLTYVSDDCDGNAVGDTWSWTGNVASGSSPTCTLTVHNSATECTIVTNTATATTPPPIELFATSTATNVDLNAPPADRSIEDSGANNGGDWQSTSDNFGTVFCNSACVNDPTLGPADGAFWAWFGGVNTANPNAVVPEVSTLTQDVVIPAGAKQLHFKLRMPTCSGGSADFLSVRVDGVEVFRVDATDATRCGAADYSDEAADISAFADGQKTRTLEFYSEQAVVIDPNTQQVSSFFVDSINFGLALCEIGPNDLIFADGFEL